MKNSQLREMLHMKLAFEVYFSEKGLLALISGFCFQLFDEETVECICATIIGRVGFLLAAVSPQIQSGGLVTLNSR